MSVEMEGLHFKIRAISEEGAGGIDALRTSLAKLRDATKGGAGLNTTVKSLEKMREALSGLQSEKLQTLSDALNSLNSTEISGNVAKQIKNIAKAMDTITAEGVERLREVGRSLREIGEIGEVRMPSLGGGTPPIDGGGGTPRISESHDVEVEAHKAKVSLKGLRGTLAGVVSAFRTAGGWIGKSFSAATRGVESGVRKLSTALLTKLSPVSKQTAGRLGQLLSSFKRIAMYRMVRATIAALTKALKEGINNLYQYSRLMGGTFAQSMNSMATNALYLKNSLGAMTAPIMNALAPAIDYVTGKIVNLFNLINMLIARLMGNSSYTAAKKVATQYGKALEGAAGSAKKLKDYTHGLDELNIFKPDEGGGGGAGSLNLDYGSMFEEVPIESPVIGFVDQIKQAFATADWKSLGSILGGKINEVFDSIDYSNVGYKLGKGLDGAFKTAHSFLDTLNLNKLGSNIAKMVNNTLSNVDTSFIGKTIVGWFTVKWDFMIGLITDLDWGMIARKVGECIKGAFSAATDWFNGYDWSAMGNSLWVSLKSMVSRIDWAGIARTALTLLGKAFRAMIGLLGSFLGSIGKDIKNWWDTEIAGQDWKETAGNLLKAIGDGLGNVGEWVYTNVVLPFCNALLGEETWAAMVQAGKDWWSGLTTGIKEGCGSIGTWIKDNISDPVVNWFKELFGIHSPSTVMKTLGDFVSQGFLNGMLAPFKSIGSWVSTNIVQPLKDAFSETDLVEFTVGVKNTAVEWWNNVQTWWKGQIGDLSVGMVIKNEASQWWSNVKSWWSGTAESLLTRLNIQLPKISLQWSTVSVFGHDFSYPSGFDIQWNAKGAILDGAQLFGMLGGKFLGGGEAGREALLPLDSHTSWMDTLADKVRDGLPGNGDGGYAEFRRALDDFYSDRVQPTMVQMAADMQRQANKKEQTTVQIGNRTVADAVTSQQSANGFRFAR